jgi:4-hydroxy 2-oxovalerate aldolase
MTSDEDQKQSGGWVSYRPEIKILDCTIRDGGLMNNHRFADETVRAVYAACVGAGVDYMEVGYKASKDIFPVAEHGPWKYSDEEDIRRIVGDNDTSLKLSVMADAEKTDYEKDILPADQSVLDLIRVATYIHQVPTALEMIQDAHEKGYEVGCNIMALSTVPEPELEEALALLVQSPIKALYIVDSFGNLYSEQVSYYQDLYTRFAEPKGITIGMHAHNNLQLAYSNTIQAIINGANMLDATMAGLGRGAGNCYLELLIGFLHNPKYHLRPVLECVHEHIEPMRDELAWGYDLPYMVTGLLNRHPRAAMRFKENGGDGDILEFYDRVLEGE